MKKVIAVLSAILLVAAVSVTALAVEPLRDGTGYRVCQTGGTCPNGNETCTPNASCPGNGGVCPNDGTCPLGEDCPRLTGDATAKQGNPGTGIGAGMGHRGNGRHHNRG